MILEGLRSALGRCYRSGLGLSLQLGLNDPIAKTMWIELKLLCKAAQFPSQFAGFVLGLGEVIFADQGSVKGRLKRLQELERRTPAQVLCYDRRRYATMVAMVREALGEHNRKS
jgi:hypothetical protein